jgi:hypothetical protein
MNWGFIPDVDKLWITFVDSFTQTAMNLIYSLLRSYTYPQENVDKSVNKSIYL